MLFAIYVHMYIITSEGAGNISFFWQMLNICNNLSMNYSTLHAHYYIGEFHIVIKVKQSSVTLLPCGYALLTFSPINLIGSSDPVPHLDPE